MHKKCDEAVTECGPCGKRGLSCSGYEPFLVWVTQNTKAYEPGRRRMLRSGGSSKAKMGEEQS